MFASKDLKRHVQFARALNSPNLTSSFIIIFVIILFVISLLIPSYFLLATNARAFEIQIHDFNENKEEQMLIFTNSSSINFTKIMFPHNATALSASMDVISLYEYGENNDSWVENVSIDIGEDNEKEWAYMGLGYGKLGNQTYFSDGNLSIQWRFQNSWNKETSILLPRNAKTHFLNLTIRGYTMPSWSAPVHLMPEGSVGEAWYPQVIEYRGRNYAVWSTNDSAVTGDGNCDYDIVVREINDTAFILDGSEASSEMDGLGDIMSISPVGDIENDSPVWDGAGPQVCVFANKLVVVWEVCNSTFSYKSDLVLRAYDGNNWSEIKQINPYGETIKNTMHQLCVYNDKLYVFWHRPYLTPYGYTAYRTVYSWSEDMNTWHEPMPIAPESNLSYDWTSTSIVYDGKIWVFWDAISPDYTDGSGYNIVVRSFDGEVWSDITQISPWNDGENYELVQVEKYENPVSGKCELWASWGTARGPSDKRGDDIFARYYNGENWSEIIEISGENETRFDLYPQLISNDGILYIVWVSGPQAVSDDIPMNETINSTVYTTWGDIVFRFYDGYFWSETIELTDKAGLDSASDPEIRVLNGSVYVIWDYNWTNENGTRDGDIIIRSLMKSPSRMSASIGNVKVMQDEEISSVGKRIELDGVTVRNILENVSSNKIFIDDFGNVICEIEVMLEINCSTNTTNTTVRLSDLSIGYDYTARLRDFSGALNKYIASYKRNHTIEDLNINSGMIEIPIKTSSSSEGKIVLSNLTIYATIDEKPSVVDIPNLYIYEDTNNPDFLDLSNYFSDDLDNGSLVYKIIYEENKELVYASINGSRLGFFTKEPNWFGNLTFKVAAFDRISQYAVAIINLTVLPVNDAPVYLGGLNTVRLEDNGTWLVDLDDYFYDVEGEIGFYKIRSENISEYMIENITIDPITRVARWHAEPNVCLKDVFITAYDAEDVNLTASSNKFSIGSQPRLPDVTFEEDTDYVNAICLDNYFKDAIAVGNLTYKIINIDGQDNISTAVKDGYISFYSMKNNWSGSARFAVEGVDELGVVSKCIFMVTVIPVNDGPVYLGGLSSVRLNQKEKWDIDLSLYFYDSDGPKIGYFTNSRGKDIIIDNSTNIASYIGKGKGIRNAMIFCTDGLEIVHSNEFSIYVSGTIEGYEPPCMLYLIVIIVILLSVAYFLRMKIKERWKKWEL